METRRGSYVGLPAHTTCRVWLSDKEAKFIKNRGLSRACFVVRPVSAPRTCRSTSARGRKTKDPIRSAPWFCNSAPSLSLLGLLTHYAITLIELQQTQGFKADNSRMNSNTCLTTHFSESIPVVMRRMSVLCTGSMKGTVRHFLHKKLRHIRPGSSVGIATDYGLDGPGSNPGGDEIFRPSRPALGPTQPPVQWLPGPSRG